MSMNADHEDFQNLKRLLALKRHEQPPPGYFDTFSVQVMARIRAGEELVDESWFSRLGWDAPWLQRLWAVFETQPIAAGALGAGVCALLVAGMVYSEQVEPAQAAFATSAPGPAAVQFAGPAAPALMVPAASYGLVNTGTVVTVGDGAGSIFNQLGRPQAQPASFRFPGH